MSPELGPLCEARLGCPARHHTTDCPHRQHHQRSTTVRTIVSTAVLALVAAGAGVVTAAPAHAEGGDQRPCATRGEYRHLHRGQTPAKVARILDTRGRPEASGRVYVICQRFAGLPHRRYVYVAYDHGQATLKEWGVTV